MEAESRKPKTPSGSSEPGSGKKGRSRSGLAGRKIGPYRITGELGKGGMGVVYRGHDTALDREVAIKVLPAHLGRDDEFMKRFVREARAAAKVDHPSIVQVYQCGRMSTEIGDGPLFIAMQFIDGEPLSALIEREGQVEPLRAVEITKQVAEALGAAHAVGMIHRDIKSSNILVSTDGKIKVTDFGLATSMESDRNKITETGAYLGTPEYSSPEQCEGHELDGRSDIYSLGVVLYEMLCGKVPFEARTPLKLFDKIVHDQPTSIGKIIPGLPRELASLVEKMLAKDREKRYASAEELLSALRRVRVALGSWKRGVGTGRRRPVSQRGLRRRSRAELIVGGVAAGLLLIAGLGIWNHARKSGQAKTPPVSRKDGSAQGTLTPARNEVGVAIFALDNLANDVDNAWIGHGIPRMLITKLRDLPGLVVYSRESTIGALAATGGKDTSAAARKLGARLAVTGTFLVRNREVRVDLHVIDVESGRVAKAIGARAPEIEILAVVDSLGQKLRGSFDSLLARILGEGGSLAKAGTRSARDCMFLALAKEQEVDLQAIERKGGYGGRDESRMFGKKSAGKSRKANVVDQLREPKSAARPADTSGAVASGDRAERSKGPAGRAAGRAPGEGGATAPDASPSRPAAPTPAPLWKSKKRPAVRQKHKRPEVADKEPAKAKAIPEEPIEEGKSVVGADNRRSILLRRDARHGRGRMVLALRYRLEAQELLSRARTRSDFRDALAKLALSKSYAENQRGLDELIEKAKRGQKTATK